MAWPEIGQRRPGHRNWFLSLLVLPCLLFKHWLHIKTLDVDSTGHVRCMCLHGTMFILHLDLQKAAFWGQTTAKYAFLRLGCNILSIKDGSYTANYGQARQTSEQTPTYGLKRATYTIRPQTKAFRGSRYIPTQRT